MTEPVEAEAYLAPREAREYARLANMPAKQATPEDFKRFNDLLEKAERRRNGNGQK
jgi:hypothetical protein